MATNIFDEIAPSWYNFRHRTIFRAELEALARRWQQGKLLNLGCAHGPDFLPFVGSFELYGIDASARMLEMAEKYASKFKFSAELIQADVTSLPYPDGSFDWAISVATYHHLESIEKRQTALAELRRVLRPEGEALITVWNRGQPRFWLKGKDTSIPWRQKNKTVYRYYHLFTYGELEKLVKYAGLEVLKSFPEAAYRVPLKFFSRNICLLVKR